MLIATDNAVFEFESADQAEPTALLEGEEVRRVEEGPTIDIVAFAGGTIGLLSGTEDRRIRTGIKEPIHSLLLLSEAPLDLLIGTEPPHVYRVTDEVQHPKRNKSFAKLECRDGWTTPWGGPAALRSLACTAEGWVYADIHVGSIMRSPDRGETWEPVTPELHVDVHQVNACPAADERVYAQTADAFWLSRDRGESWLHLSSDLDERYGRSVAVHPADPDLVLATVSDGPHGDNVHGRLYRTEDAGDTWTHVAGGFPGSAEDNIDTFHVAFSADGLAWACVGDVLYVGRERATAWEPFWTAPGRISMIACRRP